MTYFDIFSLAVIAVVFVLAGWVIVNLVRHRKSWFIVLFFLVFIVTNAVSATALFIEDLPDWIRVVRVTNFLVFIVALMGLIYEARSDN